MFFLVPSRPQRGAMASAAVSSVLYSRPDAEHSETKRGSYVYWGDAANFHEWEFRTRLKILSVKEEDRTKIIAECVDGLRGDAFTVAQQIGLDELVTRAGCPCWCTQCVRWCSR